MRAARIAVATAGLLVAAPIYAQLLSIDASVARHPHLEATSHELEQQRADDRTVARVRAAADASLKATRTTAYRDYFVSLPEAGVPPSHDDDWPYWTALCAELRGHMAATARAWALTGERRYLSWCRDLMIAVSQWPQWTDPDYGNGQPGLDTASLLRGMCVGYDYLYGDLPERDRDQIARAIADKGAEFISDYGEREGSYLKDPRTWPSGFAIINAEMGIAGATLILDDERAYTWLNRMSGKRNMFFEQQGGVDGGLVEGFSFGGAAVDAFIYQHERERAISNAHRLNYPYLDRAIYFPLYFITPGGGTLANFGDSGGPHGCPPALLGLAQYVMRAQSSAEAAWYLRQVGAHSPEVAERAVRPDHLPPARHFRSINWVAMRTGWGSGDSLLAFRSGSSDHHNHRDQNSLILACRGEWLLNDPGYQVYSRPYPAERELTEEMIKERHAYTAGTFGHNAILVDGRPQLERDGSITHFARTIALSCATGDASDCYGPTVTAWQRHVASVAPDYYAIFDEVATDGGDRGLDLLLHTTPEGRFTVGGAPLKLDQQWAAGEARVLGRSSEALISFTHPQQPTFTHRRWPWCEQYGHFLKVSLAPAPEHLVGWVVAAGPRGKVALDTRPAEAGEGAVGMQVRLAGAVDTLALNRGGGTAEVGEMSFAGRWGLMRSDGGELSRWALIQGTLLRHGTEILIASDVPVTAGALVEEGGFRISVECPEAATVLLHCPIPAALVEMIGVSQPVEVALDEAAGTMTLNLPAGSCELAVRGR